MGFLRHQIRIENGLRSTMVSYKEHLHVLSKKPRLSIVDMEFLKEAGNYADVRKSAAYFKKDLKDITMKKVFETDDLEKVSSEEKACFNRAYSLPNNVDRRGDIIKNLALIVDKYEKQKVSVSSKQKLKGKSAKKEQGFVDLVKAFANSLLGVDNGLISSSDNKVGGLILTGNRKR